MAPFDYAHDDLAEQADTDIRNAVMERLHERAEDEIRNGAHWVRAYFTELQMASECAAGLAALSLRCALVGREHPSHDELSQQLEQTKRDAIAHRIALADDEERDELEIEIRDEWADV